MPDTTSATAPNARAAPAGPPAASRVAAVPGTGSTAASSTRER